MMSDLCVCDSGSYSLEMRNVHWSQLHLLFSVAVCVPLHRVIHIH